VDVPNPRLAADDAVDLHLHTLASDGFWTPAALIDYLAERTFKVASVCDHDTQRSVAEAIRLGRERGVHIIPGVEVTCRWEGRQLHVLVYGIDPERRDPAAAAFQAGMARLDADLQERAVDARRRIERSGRALPALAEIIGGRPLWPFHVLSAAIQDKHAANLTQAANLVVELGGVFTADLAFEEVVVNAHEAGGLCVMAHPGRADAVGVVTEADFDRILATIPLDGLEAHYRSYTDAQTALYRDMAQRRGLLVSCGSDSHAPGKPVDPRPYRAEWCRDLLARLGIEVDPPPNGDQTWRPGADAFAVAPKLVPEPTSPAPVPPAGSNGHQTETAPATSTEELAAATIHDGQGRQ
jgi:predicted metal-dependent phosphoesterase TrpH